MKRVVIIMVVIGVAVFFKMRNQGDNSEQVLSDMRVIISSLDVYEANSDYLDQILETRHMKAFRDSYEMGRRRRGPTFEEDKYIQDVLTMMVKDCNRDNERDLAATLVALREAILAEE